MYSGLNRTAPPATQLLTVDQVKAQARIDTDADDTLISGLIDVATQLCEVEAQRSFITQQWVYSMPQFGKYRILPRTGLVYVAPIAVWGRSADIIHLPRPPLQSVQTINYMDMSGTLQTCDPATYWVDTLGTFGSVAPNPAQNQLWPQTILNCPNACRIYYTAGYGDDPSDVPPVAIHAVLMTAAYLYEYREITAVGGGVSRLPLEAKQLLDCIRVVEA